MGGRSLGGNAWFLTAAAKQTSLELKLMAVKTRTAKTRLDCPGGTPVKTCSPPHLVLLADMRARPCRRAQAQTCCASTWSGRWAPRASCPDCASWERLLRAEEGSGCTGRRQQERLFSHSPAFSSTSLGTTFVLLLQ